MFEVIHSLLLVPIVAVGIAVGSACGPLLGGVDGFFAWKKIKAAHDEAQELKKVQEQVEKSPTAEKDTVQ